MEENPWDVFETVFTEGSTHEGTITEITAKGLAIVSLQYGVEGIATKKNIEKEDGSLAKVDEKLSFKVLEFNKNAKKIVLSHTQLFKETEPEEGAKPAASGKSKAKGGKEQQENTTSKAVKKNNDSMEKSTLGDIDALSALKASLEKGGK
ncbi:MAG TPA: S1 RNA-binding domain-containing protein [Vicingus sp.]|nr:S1 RNA-binding domain-containing protein [Vicingus sp.]